MKTTMTKRTIPVLGELTPDPIGEILETEYMLFCSPRIDGLAKEKDGHLEILAVRSRQPGCGQFRQFIAECQKAFKSVAVWEDWNPILGPALQRYGFQPATITDRHNETLTGWKWTNPNV